MSNPLHKLIREPFPEGWQPRFRDQVIVPSKNGCSGAHLAVVEAVFGLGPDGVVRVRVPGYNNVRWVLLARDIRPRPCDPPQTKAE